MKTVPAPGRGGPSVRAVGAAALGWLGRAALLGLVLAIASSAGCSGCRSQNAAAPKTAAQKKAAEEKKAADEKAKEEEELARLKKKEKKPDYELAKLTSYPDDPDQVQNFVKPGHWVTMTEQLRANNFDMSAEFELSATDRDGKPYLVEETDFHLRLARPIGLPKGQLRTLELTTYVPRAARAEGAQEVRRVWFDGRLLEARNSKLLGESREATTAMEAHEHFLVVLAREPNNYRFLKLLDSIAPPAFDAEGARRFDYRVILPPLDQFVPLPSHPLTWTTIAYVFWDNIDPNLLSSEQQLALLDWIHWGGQLIVSGPGSLDSLKNSFLGPFLPADSGGSRDLGPEQLKELSDYWSLPRVKEPSDRRTLSTPGNRPLLGVTLALRPEGAFVAHTGELVCERRVGGGRIVVTGLPCGDESLRGWRSFDNFMNGCLLRRPGRDFQPLANLNDNFAEPQWVGRQVGSTDPRMLSTLRYLTRDYGTPLDATPGETGQSTADSTEQMPQANGTAGPGSEGGPALERLGQRPRYLNYGKSGALSSDEYLRESRELRRASNEAAARDDYRFSGARRDPSAGVAGWNDDSGSAAAVRQIVSEAAGINIPDARFILRMMAIYLTVLVPVNWLVFRLLGRVEWAWIAVPICAIIGAVAVIRLAQLDIGFVRSRREIAVLETQGGYDRGHLTRYNLLYASLSTGYDVTFSDPSAVAQPISKGVPTQLGLYASARNVSFRRDDAVRLSDFLVVSNSAELLHSEQMFPLGGPMELLGGDSGAGAGGAGGSGANGAGANGAGASHGGSGSGVGWELHHHGELSLKEVAVVRRTGGDRYELAWIGDLPGRSQRKLEFQAIEPDEAGVRTPWVANWDSSPTMRRAGAGQSREINLGRLADLALRRMQLGIGDVRLVGWTDQELAGIQFNPIAAQNDSRTLVVCHLRRGSLPAIERDANVRLDYYSVNDNANQDETE